MLSIPHPLVSESIAPGPSLPVSTEGASPVSRASEALRGKTVLLVDDDSALRMTTALILGCQGGETLEAGHGLEALDILQRNPQVSAVLLDLLMPVMNGEETFRQLRHFWPAIPVIVISGFNIADSARMFATPPPEAFLQKPFTFDNLITTLGHVLA